MDTVFLLEGKARSSFIQSIGQALGCTYVCLWSYLPQPSNCLISIEGWYNDDGDQPSSSSGSIARRLFDAYRRSICSVESGCVPGYAFKNGVPCIELQYSELVNLASTEIQRQFYQEARIKTAIFNGCRSGELELGMSSPNKNLKMEMNKWFPEDQIQQYQLRESLLADQSRPSSSSSSLRSLSVGSPESSSLLLNIVPETPIEQGTRPSTVIPTHVLTMQAYTQIRNIHLPMPGSEDEAVTRAMLAVLSSPASSSSSYQSQVPTRQQELSRRSAFRSYDSALFLNVESRPISFGQNKTKRLISFLRSIRMQMQETRPTSNQLHHMISERKRREKLNESFQALRSLLPPGSKKDKASVLANTREYLSKLKAQVTELQEKNRSLEEHISPKKEAYKEPTDVGNERVVVQVAEAFESSSEGRQIELCVMVREEDCNMTDLLLRLLDCLKQMHDVAVVSVDASAILQQTNPFNRVIFRINIKAREWDQRSFKEAMTRAAGNVAQGGPSIS